MARIGETTACLRIFGDALDADEVNRLLGCLPTDVVMKGEVRKSGFVERTSMWSLERDRFAPGNLDEKLKDLLEATTDDPEVWLGLHERFDVDVFAGLFMSEGNEGLTLTPSTMEALARRGLELHLDIYAP
jgi:Domain of unknown function (DUF4279)